MYVHSAIRGIEFQRIEKMIHIEYQIRERILTIWELRVEVPELKKSPRLNTELIKLEKMLKIIMEE